MLCRGGCACSRSGACRVFRLRDSPISREQTDSRCQAIAGHAAVQPIMPRLPHQAADDKPALWSRTVTEFSWWQRASNARHHWQWNTAHARIQISFRLWADRGNCGLPEDHSNADPGRDALKAREQGKPVMNSARISLLAVLSAMVIW